MHDLFAPMTLTRGPAWKNRFMLAPLTNTQSHADGRLSDDEYRWLTYRAEGGFGLVMTCAAHVQAVGQGFPGQLGVFGDEHVEGLGRLATGIRDQGAASSVQLHHAGIRSPKELVGAQPVGPCDDEETGARALTGAEVEQLTEDFIAAALRSEKAGFDGVELHGAHGYILCAFLSPQTNRRTDEWGGSLANRSRIVRDIVAGIRSRCRADFQLGLRISPERFGVGTAEMRELMAELLAGGALDYMDLSLWDCFKTPIEADFRNKPLIEWFMDLPRFGTRVGVAGKIRSGGDVRRVIEAGADFAVIGRAAILHHDYPKKIAADAGFTPLPLPVTREHLREEHLGEVFIDYMASWSGFVTALGA